jgi:glycosyltransferase involved in cell wall biosynthesis
MPGFVSDPVPVFASADLFALSSDYEGFGNVIVESLACGVGVVFTDCQSGPSEILENGKYGSLVATGDEDAFSEAIIHSINHPLEPALLKDRARAFVPSVAAMQYLQLLFPEMVKQPEGSKQVNYGRINSK